MHQLFSQDLDVYVVVGKIEETSYGCNVILQKHPFKKDFTPLCGGGSIIVKHWHCFLLFYQALMLFLHLWNLRAF